MTQLLNESCLNLRKLDRYEYDPMTYFVGSTETYEFEFFKFLKENTTSNIWQNFPNNCKFSKENCKMKSHA